MVIEKLDVSWWIFSLIPMLFSVLIWMTNHYCEGSNGFSRNYPMLLVICALMLFAYLLIDCAFRTTHTSMELKIVQAAEYIKTVQSDVEAITPRRFCENELLNLLCSSFFKKAENKGVRLTAEAHVPSKLSLSDTELCSVLSNGLENALRSAAELDAFRGWVELYCEVKRNQFRLEIKNPYAGEVVMQGGLPVSNRAGHGYGCRSICAIAERHQGLCTFEPKDGIFTLRLMLPTENDTARAKQ